MTFRWCTVVAASGLWLSAIPAGAQWSQCASDLNELSTVARGVQETADKAASIQGEAPERGGGVRPLRPGPRAFPHR